MKRHHRIALASAIMLMLTGAAAWAAFDLSWYTVDAGGGISTGAGFQLSGTVGQADAGPTLTGGGFALVGGFWAHRGTLLPGDCDLDGGVGLDDLTCFAACMAGPVVSVADECHSYDFDQDGDVDLFDYAVFSTQ